MKVYIPDLEAAARMGLADKLRSVPGIDLRIGNVFSADAQYLLDTVDDAEVLCVVGGRVTREVIATARRLRLIVECGIGTDNIDVVAAKDRQIVVLRTPGANFEAVAEFVIGGSIASFRRLAKFDSSIRHQGVWAQLRQESAGVLPSLAGRTIGIVGVGAVGREVARLALAHKMHVLGYDPFVPTFQLESIGAMPASLEDLLEQSDIVSVHVLLSDSTKHMIGASELARMRPTALLVNTSRGPTVDEKALLTALQSHSIGGALLDVFEIEPPPESSPLFELDNCLLSPHVAGCTDRSYGAVGSRARELVVTFLHGSSLPADCIVST